MPVLSGCCEAALIQLVHDCTACITSNAMHSIGVSKLQCLANDWKARCIRNSEQLMSPTSEMTAAKRTACVSLVQIPVNGSHAQGNICMHSCNRANLHEHSARIEMQVEKGVSDESTAFWPSHHCYAYMPIHDSLLCFARVECLLASLCHRYAELL